jgi:hypothetical protein
VAVPAQEPRLGVTESSVTPLGTTSDTVASSTGFCPAVTVIVYVRSPRNRMRDEDAFRLSCGSPQVGRVNAPIRVAQLNDPVPG